MPQYPDSPKNASHLEIAHYLYQWALQYPGDPELRPQSRDLRRLGKP
jgi:hypothetical protein